MYMYIPKLETVRPDAGKNESNFKKNIHLRKRLFFLLLDIQMHPFFRFSSCASLFFPFFSFATRLITIPPLPLTPYFRVPRNQFYFHSNSRFHHVKTHGDGGMYAKCRITRSNPYFRECVFRCRCRFFFCSIYTQYTRIAWRAQNTNGNRSQKLYVFCICIICKSAVNRVPKPTGGKNAAREIDERGWNETGRVVISYNANSPVSK